jgi:hypothetical protein
VSARIRRLSPSARTCVFVKQSPGPVCCNPSKPSKAGLSPSSLYSKGHPFSRSYGVSLPSSLTRDLPTALGLLPPPTCVGLRYGRPAAPPDLFSTPQAQSDRLWVAPPALDHLSGEIALSPRASTWTPTPRPTYLQAHLASLSPLSRRRLHNWSVQEYKPVVHRLRVLPPRLRPD